MSGPVSDNYQGPPDVGFVAMVIAVRWLMDKLRRAWWR